MIKRILVTGVSVMFLASCSDNVSPPEAALSGHWLHNPGQCELKLEAKGLFDLKIDAGAIHIGDSETPLPGEWLEHDDNISIKNRAKEWLSDCPTATFSSKQIDEASTYLLSSPVQDVYFVELPNRWLMIDEESVRLLLPFEDVKSMELPIVYPESKGEGEQSSNSIGKHNG